MTAKKQLFMDYVNITKLFIGFKKSEAIVLMENKIIKLLCKYYNFNEMEINSLVELKNQLNEINTYNDYKMFIKSKENEKRFADVTNDYFKILELKENKIEYLDDSDLKKIINNGSVKGNIDCLRLKAILMYLGDNYSQNCDKSLEILKILGYIGDSISIKLLSIFDLDNSDYYKQLYNCIQEIYDSFIFDLNDLHYDKEILDTCKLIFENKRKFNNEDSQMLEYLFLNKNSKIKKIDGRLGKIENKQRIGF